MTCSTLYRTLGLHHEYFFPMVNCILSLTNSAELLNVFTTSSHSLDIVLIIPMSLSGDVSSLSLRFP